MKLAFVFLVALPIFGQGMVGMSGSFGVGPDGGMRGTATFHLSPFLPPPVINAPYSGEEVGESSQILVDGTHITRPNMGPQQKTWRDSQGRVRTERSLGPRRDNNTAVIVEIHDPVAGYVYVLDTVNHVAHRIHVDASPTAPPAASIRPPSAPAGSGGGAGTAVATAPRLQSTQEQLGTKMIDGVLVSGVRTTTIIPEGAQGNDRPITTTSESWVSNQLHLPLLTVAYNPMSGTMTRKFANFSTAEPAPSLFILPPGYTIVDETGSFTIRWGEQ